MVVHEACIAAMEHGSDYDLDKLITGMGGQKRVKRWLQVLPSISCRLEITWKLGN